ncbi:hypothetical protein, partial [Mycobacterium tuberculosis]|uniref:hypothetical protein n=1 Tax=Mycobacterium tuberculosis TaxID=1773 RepID=UPI001BDBA977
EEESFHESFRVASGEMKYTAWISCERGINRIYVQIQIAALVIHSAHYNFETLERDYDFDDTKDRQCRDEEYAEQCENFERMLTEKFRREGRLKW